MSPDYAWRNYGPGERVRVDGEWGVVIKVLSEEPYRCRVYLDKFKDDYNSANEIVCEYQFGSLMQLTPVSALEQLAEIE